MKFIYMETTDGKQRLLNLDQVKLVDEIHDGHCKLVFDDKITVEINGEGADILTSRLLGEAELFDGSLMSDHVDELTSRDPSAKIQLIKPEDETGQHE